MKYISIKNLFIIIVILSLSANIFYFGREAIRKERQKYFEAGNVQTRNAIYNMAKQGEVLITNGEGEEVILIIKNEKK